MGGWRGNGGGRVLGGGRKHVDPIVLGKDGWVLAEGRGWWEE